VCMIMTSRVSNGIRGMNAQKQSALRISQRGQRCSGTNRLILGPCDRLAQSIRGNASRAILATQNRGSRSESGVLSEILGVRQPRELSVMRFGLAWLCFLRPHEPLMLNVMRGEFTLRTGQPGNTLTSSRLVTAHEIAAGLLGRNLVEAAFEQEQEKQSLEWIASNMVSWFSHTIVESEWARAFQRTKVDGLWAYKPNATGNPAGRFESL